MKKLYIVTEKAGRFVAGQRAAVGAKLNLTERQAAHEIRLGTIREFDAAAEAAAKNAGNAPAEG